MTILKLIRFFIKKAMYDEVDVDGVKVMQFNPYRFVGSFILILSIGLNGWLMSRYIADTTLIYDVIKRASVECPKFTVIPPKKIEKKP